MAAPVQLDNNMLRVSSVLNRDTKQFGKKFLVDGDDDTCWNSDQGSPQWIQVDFERLVTVSEVGIQFQGGFVGKDCVIEGRKNSEDKYTCMQQFYPEDVNAKQIFKLQNPESVQMIRLVFNNSTDFFGRITIYKLEISEEDS